MLHGKRQQNTACTPEHVAQEDQGPTLLAYITHMTELRARMDTTHH